MKNIEENIRFALRKKGMTIRQLAEKSGIPEPSLHRILKSGDYKFSHLVKMHEAIEVDFYDLVGIPPSRDHSFLPLKEIPEENQVVLEKVRYEAITLEVKRLRKRVSFLQERLLEIIGMYGLAKGVINFTEPKPEDDPLI